MARLARSDRAFIRLSPSGGALVGVARKTREALLVCEAAAFDVVLVETVGVGQSETEVADMVDCFLVLMLPNAGDELQGIKRGIVELADLVAVTKADGALEPAAKVARQHYQSALALFTPREPCWRPEVLTISARTGAGLDELFERVEAMKAALSEAGRLEALRAEQALRWMWRAVDAELRRRLRDRGDVRALAAELEAEVRAGAIPPTAAAARILARFLG